MSEVSPGLSVSTKDGNGSLRGSKERLEGAHSTSSVGTRPHAVRSAMKVGPRGLRPSRKVGFAPTIEIVPSSIELSTFSGSNQPPDSPLLLSSPPAPSIEPDAPSPTTRTDETPPSPPLRRRRMNSTRNSISQAPPSPSPDVMLTSRRDVILAVLATKRFALHSAELRHRAAAGGGTTALYSTLGMALAVAIEVPLALVVKTVPVGVLIALPPFVWILAAFWGALIEIGRVRYHTASTSTDRACAKAITVNLCRLITDVDKMRERSATRKLLMEDSLRTLSRATGLTGCAPKDMTCLHFLMQYSLYAGQGFVWQIGINMVLGPLYLYLHLRLARQLHPGMSRAEAAWLFGGDQERTYVHMLAENVEPWSDLVLAHTVTADAGLEYQDPGDHDSQETDQLSPPVRQRIEHATV